MSFSIYWNDIPEKADKKDIFSDFFLKEEGVFCAENSKSRETKDFCAKNNKSYEQNDSGTVHTFIKGDNYPALKLLQKSYNSKIDFIYIDPPYNTKKTNFAYNDSKKTDEWLSFLYRRLTSAKELLSETGCIFIAISQEQSFLLKIVCDKIFGEENFVNDFLWLHGKGKKDSWSRTMQESNLCYAKNKKKLKPFYQTEKTNWAKTNADNDERGLWFSGSISFSEKRSNPAHKNFYTVTSPSGKIWNRQWLIPKEEMESLIAQNKIYFGSSPDFSKVPRKKIFNNEESKIIPRNIIQQASSTRKAQQHLDFILGEKCSFDNPKPVDLIQHFIEISNQKKDAIVLDFFAGSGTTFEAVINQNKKDGGKRTCILIQKEEILVKKQTKFSSIAELCLERCKKVLPEQDKIKCLSVQEKP